MGVQNLSTPPGVVPPGGSPLGVSSRRYRPFVSENISHADPQIEPILTLPLHRNSSKICSFPDCLEIQHAALGSNTYLQGTYEEAATDEFLLDHPVQRLAGWGKSLGQISAGRIMLV